MRQGGTREKQTPVAAARPVRAGGEASLLDPELWGAVRDHVDVVLKASVLWFVWAWVPLAVAGWPVVYAALLADPGERLWPVASMVAVAVAGVVMVGPANAACAAMARAARVEREDVGWRDFFRYMARYGVGGAVASLVLGAAALVWWVDFFFLVTVLQGVARGLLAGFWLGVGAGLVLAAVWVYPALVAEQGAVGRAVVQSVRIARAYPGASMQLALGTLLGFGLGFVLQLPLVFLYAGFTSLLGAGMWQRVAPLAGAAGTEG